MPGRKVTKIGIMAPGRAIDRLIQEKVCEQAARLYPDGRVELRFHPQCFLSWGHFAGTDGQRAKAFLDVANDASIDVLWFARGGYGSFRLIEQVLPALEPAARDKLYLGYSDGGAMLSALYGAGIGRQAHGPMPYDAGRQDGAAAIARALAYAVDGDQAAVEPHRVNGIPTIAFNITILAHLIGTPYLPDLTGHVLMLEDICEPMYHLDRALGQITSVPEVRRAAGLRLGRCNQIVPNDPDFGQDEDMVARYWCHRSGIAYLGRADIGHDSDNKVVPFGP